jgi:hypothetical protein
MSVDVVVKLAALGVLVMLARIVLESIGDRREYGLLLTIAGVVGGFLGVIPLLTNLIQSVKTLFNL